MEGTPTGTLPLRSNSRKIVRAIGARLPVHADFGSGLWEGADRNPDHGRRLLAGDLGRGLRLRRRKRRRAVSDPNGLEIEGGGDSDGDRHAIIVDSDSCTPYELFALYPSPWRAGSEAIWGLTSNALRPRGWTSADD